MLVPSTATITATKHNVWTASSLDVTPVEAQRRQAPHLRVTALVSVGDEDSGEDLLQRTLLKSEVRERYIDAEEQDQPTELEQEEHVLEDRGSGQLEAANVDRIRLLARQYVRQQMNREELARLAILTERISQLIPSVTVGDYEKLESMVSRLYEIRNADDRLRTELGLGGK
jgi:hypothetical protein